MEPREEATQQGVTRAAREDAVEARSQRGGSTWAAIAFPRLQISIDPYLDSTGPKLSGAGEWLIEKHGTRTRRFWRKLHIGMDAETGEIVAAELTTNNVDHVFQVGPLLGQVAGPLASFTGDGAYDQDNVYRAVAHRQPSAAVIVPPRSTAVISETATIEPTQRDHHVHCIAEKGRARWQKASGYNKRSRIEAAIRRTQQVIGDRLRARQGGRRTTEVSVAALVLNRMLELVTPDLSRIA